MKRRQALRSATCQGIASWKLIRFDERGRGLLEVPDRALIERIDFPMPEKTHKEAAAQRPPCVCAAVALELGRRQVAERRVQALLVVDLLQKHAHAGLGLGQIAIFRAVDLFVLQGFHKRFARGIVPGIGFPRHADADAVVLEQLRVIGAGVLHAAIGVMHQSRPTARRLANAMCKA